MIKIIDSRIERTLYKFNDLASYESLYSKIETGAYICLKTVVNPLRKRTGAQKSIP